jgi:hypothetical protein
LNPRDPFTALIQNSAALAQFVGGNYDDAIRLAQSAIRLRADLSSAHRVLVTAAGMSGRTGLAGTALEELRRVQPAISRAWIMKHVPLKLDADRVHYLEGLHRAGLD